MTYYIIGVFTYFVYNVFVLFMCCHVLFYSGEPFYADKDDDFIFEDFARLRLKGDDADDVEV